MRHKRRAKLLPALIFVSGVLVLVATAAPARIDHTVHKSRPRAMQVDIDPRTVADDQNSWIDTAAALAIILQALAVIGGAIWGFYLYLHGRRGQVRVGVRATARIHRDLSDTHSVLLVHLRIVNTSAVLYRHGEATATLMDARKRAADGSVRLAPFSQADPIVPVHAEISSDVAEVAAGRTFRPLPMEAVLLEPGEHLETEIAFPIRKDKLGLMAVRVLVAGFQGRRGRELFWWGTFVYVDPEALSNQLPEPEFSRLEGTMRATKKLAIKSDRGLDLEQLWQSLKEDPPSEPHSLDSLPKQPSAPAR